MCSFSVIRLLLDVVEWIVKMVWLSGSVFCIVLLTLIWRYTCIRQLQHVMRVCDCVRVWSWATTWKVFHFLFTSSYEMSFRCRWHLVMHWDSGLNSWQLVIVKLWHCNITIGVAIEICVVLCWISLGPHNVFTVQPHVCFMITDWIYAWLNKNMLAKLCLCSCCCSKVFCDTGIEYVCFTTVCYVSVA